MLEDETHEEYLARDASVLRPVFSLSVPTYTGPIQNLPQPILGRARTPFDVSICPTQMPVSSLQEFVDRRVSKVADYNPDFCFRDIAADRFRQTLAFVATNPHDVKEILGWFVFERSISGDPADPERESCFSGGKDPYLNPRARLEIGYDVQLENCFIMPEWRNRRIAHALGHLVAETIVGDLKALATQSARSVRVEPTVEWEAVSDGGEKIAHRIFQHVKYEVRELRREIRNARVPGSPRIEILAPEPVW